LFWLQGPEQQHCAFCSGWLNG